MKEFEVKELDVSLITPAKVRDNQQLKLPFTTFDIMQKRSSMPYLQRVSFYTSTKSDEENNALIENMKKSLADVLVDFYPLAGRLSIEHEGDRPEIACNGAGVEFSVAIADVSLAEVDYTHPQPWFSKLIQRGKYEFSGLLTNIPFLTVQVTKFKCGGICVAWSYDHLVIDGSSQWYFMCSWSKVARGQGIPSLPTHDRFFEQNHEQFDGITPTSSFSYAFDDVSIGMEAKVFEFDERVVHNLKSIASQAGTLDPFTAFEVVASHIWITMSKARQLRASQNSIHQLPVNCRSRLSTPLPQDYFGNCVLCAIAQATVGELTTGGLPFTAGIIHDAIKTFEKDEIRSRVATYNSDTQGSNPFTVGVTDGVHIYGGSSHRFPMYSLDFGWGKPAAVRHARNLWDGFCFYDPSPKEGIVMEVTVALPPETMQKFGELLYVGLDK